MKNLIIKKIESDKELCKSISKISHYTHEDFVRDANIYLKAIKEGRMLCVIKSVSKSGMSRVIAFHSCQKHQTSNFHNYRQYNCLFEAMGYKESKNSNGFTVHGCGMDMIFHTNYTIIHKLHRLGFITKEACGKLAQQTPTIL